MIRQIKVRKLLELKKIVIGDSRIIRNEKFLKFQNLNFSHKFFPTVPRGPGGTAEGRLHRADGSEVSHKL